MVFYVTVGGMKGTTWVQIVKAVLLMVGSALIVVLVLGKFHFNLSDLLGTAASNTGKGQAFLEPGLKYGATTTSKIDFLSLGIALVLGTAGLPHILIRFYTVPTSRDARKSVLWAIGLIGVFYLFTLVLGFGAAALLKGDEAEQVATSGGNLASPLLAENVGGGAGSTGGAILLAVIAAVAFATILAVVAGLVLTSSTSVAHDLYNSVSRRARPPRRRSCRWPGIAAGGIGLVAILLAIPAQKLNVAFLVALAFAVAASANLPAIVYNMFWRALQHPRRGLEHLRRADLLGRPGDLQPDHVRQGPGPRPARTCRCCPPASTSPGSRWRTPASSRSRSASCSATSARSAARSPRAAERYTELEVRALTGAGSEKASSTEPDPAAARRTCAAPPADGRGQPRWRACAARAATSLTVPTVLL